MGRSLLTRLMSFALGVLIFVLVTARVPYWWCARSGEHWYDGDFALQTRLAAGVEEWVSPGADGLDRGAFATGSSQLDGEWLFGTYLMSGIGFAQLAAAHPEMRERYLPLVDRCIERMLSPEVRAHDRESWGDADPIDAIDGDEFGHLGYLGYVNVLLGLRRCLGDMSHADLNDQITEYLTRAFEQSPSGLLLTYPDEVYALDNTTVAASLALHQRATGADHSATLRRWMERFREHCIDPRTGLLFQAEVYDTGEPSDEPRGSGTAFGAYFLSFADKALSRELYDAVKRELADRRLGFGVMREYPRGAVQGPGDIDSGPVVFGYAISPTGFSIANARIHGDREMFVQLYATAHAFGAPIDKGRRLHFVTGGPLGDAIMFAMLTAQSDLFGDAKGEGK